MTSRQRMGVRSQLIALCVAAAGVAVLAGGARAVPITGTIQYTGSQGPVSAARPILILVFEDALFRNFPVATATVTSSGGSFELNVPGTNYLAYVLDVNGNGESDVGEPGEVFNNQAGLPADPIALPRSLTLVFDDTALVSGIGGTTTYTGNKGQVSVTQRIVVESFLDEDLTERTVPRLRGAVENNGGTYHINTLDAGTYYLRAFFDLNGNFRFEAGEPFEIYAQQSAPPATAVNASRSQTAIDFEFGDANTLCVGDCGGDGEVTINELLVMVNVALGNAAVLACTVGDADGDGEIAVNEIIAAVNVALSGCHPTERACLDSGGTVTTALCCAAVDEFPDTCAVGACGCSPGASHEVRVCDCGSGSCFDGTGCVR